ncbi:outer membrane protein [Salmonella enterica subsp. enterica serovar Sanjuan]|uniref:Outer membrane protein n=1 Tax=Salmonella enterica subsp. enterica serovar Sanjuan TaxID=1160765 RepID=A0A3S4EUH1_SALET|nr:outer membrane protein [Salmonella enterica subsp. enterica serovar Sanjuan]
MDEIATAIAALALVSAPSLVMAAPGSCERVKSDIEQRIINNGVPADNFTLTIVPNDQADQPDSQVVGHCANDTHKILYTRTSSGNAPANTSPAQDGSSAEPQ